MKNKLLIMLGVICLQFVQLSAQKEDKVLFTVDDKPVLESEYRYIYEKNNGKNANYSKASLNEYLDLYIKFKLKVAKARGMQLDTIPVLIKELEGYRRQLAGSYLKDKEVSNRLTKELYDRMQYDVDVSHILIQVKKDASPADTVSAYMQAKSVSNMLDQGQSFEELAKKFSSDKHSAKTGGRIGYVSAKLPDGFYALETAVYNAKLGVVTGPVRTSVGYHILKVHDKRSARGWVDAAHILVRKNKKGLSDVKAMQKIQKIHEQLLAGGSFEELVAKFSEDKTTNKKKGRIGRFGINKFESSFEDAAFNLAKDGDVSAPIETQIGWHIIKRLKKKDLKSYKLERRQLESKISKDGRFAIAQDAMIGRIQKESNYSMDKLALASFMDNLDGTLFSYKWKIPTFSNSNPIMKLGTKSFNAADISKHFKRNTKTRLSMDSSTPLKEGFDRLITDFIKEKAIDYEEANLEKKYPDFKSLMREYEEGILLFEATKINVWDMASQDTVGLEKYYSEHTNDYTHERRAVVNTITMEGVSKKIADKIYKRAKTKTLSKTFSKRCIKKIKEYNLVENLQDEKTVAKIRSVKFETGSMSALVYDEDTQNASFQKVTTILPTMPKTLSEARGYIIADYQDQLEKEWVISLRKEYDVIIDKNVFNSLIKK